VADQFIFLQKNIESRIILSHPDLRVNPDTSQICDMINSPHMMTHGTKMHVTYLIYNRRSVQNCKIITSYEDNDHSQP
jgi:hypothetical protein